MTTDEMLADIRAALRLTDTQRPVSLLIACEFVDFDPDAESPEQRRLTYAWSDELTWWAGVGIADTIARQFADLIDGCNHDEEGDK